LSFFSSLVTVNGGKNHGFVNEFQAWAISI
jgi:hypothetical protein